MYKEKAVKKSVGCKADRILSIIRITNKDPLRVSNDGPFFMLEYPTFFSHRFCGA
jgi:hypothetical protein